MDNYFVNESGYHDSMTTSDENALAKTSEAHSVIQALIPENEDFDDDKYGWVRITIRIPKSVPCGYCYYLTNPLFIRSKNHNLILDTLDILLTTLLNPE